MAGYLLHVNATLLCPHAGQGSIISTNLRVKVGGQPVALLNDTTLIAGCPLNISSVPQPCTRVQWVVPATRVRVGGQMVLLQDSQGLCLGPTQAPQGPPNIVMTQVRVKGQ